MTKRTKILTGILASASIAAVVAGSLIGVYTNTQQASTTNTKVTNYYTPEISIAYGDNANAVLSVNLPSGYNSGYTIVWEYSATANGTYTNVAKTLTTYTDSTPTVKNGVASLAVNKLAANGYWKIFITNGTKSWTSEGTALNLSNKIAPDISLNETTIYGSTNAASQTLVNPTLTINSSESVNVSISAVKNVSKTLLSALNSDITSTSANGTQTYTLDLSKLTSNNLNTLLNSGAQIAFSVDYGGQAAELSDAITFNNVTTSVALPSSIAYVNGSTYTVTPGAITASVGTIGTHQTFYYNNLSTNYTSANAAINDYSVKDGIVSYPVGSNFTTGNTFTLSDTLAVGSYTLYTVTFTNVTIGSTTLLIKTVNTTGVKVTAQTIKTENNNFGLTASASHVTLPVSTDSAVVNTSSIVWPTFNVDTNVSTFTSAVSSTVSGFEASWFTFSNNTWTITNTSAFYKFVSGLTATDGEISLPLTFTFSDGGTTYATISQTLIFDVVNPSFSLSANNSSVSVLSDGNLNTALSFTLNNLNTSNFTYSDLAFSINGMTTKYSASATFSTLAAIEALTGYKDNVLNISSLSVYASGVLVGTFKTNITVDITPYSAPSPKISVTSNSTATAPTVFSAFSAYQNADKSNLPVLTLALDNVPDNGYSVSVTSSKISNLNNYFVFNTENNELSLNSNDFANFISTLDELDDTTLAVNVNLLDSTGTVLATTAVTLDLQSAVPAFTATTSTTSVGYYADGALTKDIVYTINPTAKTTAMFTFPSGTEITLADSAVGVTLSGTIGGQATLSNLPSSVTSISTLAFNSANINGTAAKASSGTVTFSVANITKDATATITSSQNTNVSVSYSLINGKTASDISSQIQSTLANELPSWTFTVSGYTGDWTVQASSDSNNFTPSMFTFSDQTLSITNSQAYADWVAANFVGNQASSQNIFINFTLYNANSGKSLALTISGQQLEFTKAIVLSGVTGVDNINVYSQVADATAYLAQNTIPSFDVALPNLPNGESYTIETHIMGNNYTLYEYADGQIYLPKSNIVNFNADLYNGVINPGDQSIAIEVLIGSNTILTLSYTSDVNNMYRSQWNISGPAQTVYSSSTNSSTLSGLNGSATISNFGQIVATNTSSFNDIISVMFGSADVVNKKLIDSLESITSMQPTAISNATILGGTNITVTSAEYDSKNDTFSFTITGSILLTGRYNFNSGGSIGYNIDVINNQYQVTTIQSAAIYIGKANISDYYLSDLELNLNTKDSNASLLNLNLEPGAGTLNNGIYTLTSVSSLYDGSYYVIPILSTSSEDLTVYMTPSSSYVNFTTSSPTYNISYGSSAETTGITVYYDEETGEFIKSSTATTADPFILTIAPSSSSNSLFNDMSSWTLQIGNTSAGLYGLATAADGKNTYATIQDLLDSESSSQFSLSTFNSDYANKVFNFSVVGGYEGANVDTNGQTYSTSNQLEITFVPVNVA